MRNKHKSISMWDSHPLYDGKPLKWAVSKHIPEELEGTKLKFTIEKGKLHFTADKFKDHWKAWGYSWAKKQLLKEIKSKGYSNYLFDDNGNPIHLEVK